MDAVRMLKLLLLLVTKNVPLVRGPESGLVVGNRAKCLPCPSSFVSKTMDSIKFPTTWIHTPSGAEAHRCWMLAVLLVVLTL